MIKFGMKISQGEWIQIASSCNVTGRPLSLFGRWDIFLKKNVKENDFTEKNNENLFLEEWKKIIN